MANQTMLHIVAVCAGGAFIKAMIAASWAGHRAKAQQRPVHLSKSRNGTYSKRKTHIDYVESVVAVIAWISAGLVVLGIVAGILVRH